MANGGVWGNVRVSAGHRSLSDVMSEQLAISLQEKEDARAAKLQQESLSADVAEQKFIRSISSDDANLVGDTSNDLEIALRLQKFYDDEANSGQQKEKEKPKKKVKKVPLDLRFDTEAAAGGELGRGRHLRGEGDAWEEDEEEEEEEEDPFYRRGPAFVCSARGYSGRGQNIRTKHDLEAASRRNGERILDCMDPKFNSGDFMVGEHQICDSVYNSLRQTAINSDQRRVARLQEKKDYSTATCAVDRRTREILYHLETQDRLRELGGVISTGKEAVIMFARGGDKMKDDVRYPEECAIKVHKTTLNEFKSRYMYIAGDFRFSKDEFKKLNPRKVIKMWTTKEMVNLRKIYKSGIPCPKPVQQINHVIVMSFIGTNGQPASQLQEAALPIEDWEDAYEQTMRCIRRLYNDCSLVHGDLSPYNLLWHEGTVWVIDVGQTVDKQHPLALELLFRDCRNMTTFFKKKGVHNVVDCEDLFNSLTGLDIEGRGEEFKKNLRTYVAATREYEADRLCLAEGVYRQEFAFEHYFRSPRGSFCEDGDAEEEEEQDSSLCANKSSLGRRE